MHWVIVVGSRRLSRRISAEIAPLFPDGSTDGDEPRPDASRERTQLVAMPAPSSTRILAVPPPEPSVVTRGGSRLYPFAAVFALGAAVGATGALALVRPSSDPAPLPPAAAVSHTATATPTDPSLPIIRPVEPKPPRQSPAKAPRAEPLVPPPPSTDDDAP